VGELLQYHRGDGSLIKIQVLPGGEIFDNVAPPQITYLRDPNAPTKPPPQLLVPTATNLAPSVFDDPIIGGKFTVFVLLYGPQAYHPLHRLCLDSLISTVPVGRMDLRIGSNALCTESVAYVDQLIAQGVVTKHYRHDGNDKKGPVMREMFWDDTHPINTRWVLWFDDDSICSRDPMWLSTLSQTIVQGYPQNNHMYGAEFSFELSAEQIRYYKSRPWFRDKPLRTLQKQPAANGNKVFFAAGGFWALSLDALRKCDIPDMTLLHNGTDVCIGEQLHQGGFGLQTWNGRKQFVYTSSVPRRGLSEPHFGTPGWRAISNRS
jgi:hypothetical protein